MPVQRPHRIKPPHYGAKIHVIKSASEITNQMVASHWSGWINGDLLTEFVLYPLESTSWPEEKSVRLCSYGNFKRPTVNVWSLGVFT